MATFIRDFSYSVRMLSKRPGFTAAAVAVLALGIGANTEIFTLVNGFLLRPLLIREPDRLAGCYSRDTRKPGAYRAFSYPNYADMRDRNPVFTNLAAHNMAMVGLAEGNSTRRVFADMVFGGAGRSQRPRNGRAAGRRWRLSATRTGKRQAPTRSSWGKRCASTAGSSRW